MDKIKKSKKASKKAVIETLDQAPQPKVIAAEKKPGFNTWHFVVVLLAAVLLFGGYQAVDYFTGWGNYGKVIKRILDSAEKNAIYKKYDSSIDKYRYVIKKWGGDAKYAEEIKQARLNLAKSLKDSENYLDAIEMYKQLSSEYKETNKDMYAWLLLELADSYSLILNSDQAIKTYSSIVDEFAGTDWSAEALFGMAESYKSKKDFKNAIKYYDIIVAKYQKGFLSAEALTNKAKILEELGKIKDAVKLYDRVVSDFPDIVTEYARVRLNLLSGKTVK